jgi:hypothetical protein
MDRNGGPKNFLERLQAADEDTKRAWTVAGAMVVMGVILFVWLAFFSGSPNAGTATVSAVPANPGFSLWETATGMIGALADAVGRFAGNIGGIVGAPKEYIIKQ